MMKGLRALARRDEDTGALGRHSALLASLILLLVALPLGQAIMGEKLRFPALLTLVLLSAIFVNRRQRWIFVASITLGLVAIGALILGELHANPSTRLLANALSLVLISLTSFVMLNSLIQTHQVSQDTIVGGICVYLLIGLSYTLVYILLIEVQPKAFEVIQEGFLPTATSSDHATALLYFSFVTLTTLGYGDISPATELAQMFAVSEALTGQLYLTIFVARLVALYVQLSRLHPGSPENPESGDQDSPQMNED